MAFRTAAREIGGARHPAAHQGFDWPAGARAGRRDAPSSASVLARAKKKKGASIEGVFRGELGRGREES